MGLLGLLMAGDGILSGLTTSTDHLCGGTALGLGRAG